MNNNKEKINSEIQNQNNTFIISKATLQSKLFTIVYIKDINGKDNIMIHIIEKNKFGVVDPEKFYYDEVEDAVIFRNKKYYLQDILNVKNISNGQDDRPITGIETADGQNFFSSKFELKEILLIILKPEYLEKINFYDRSLNLTN